MKVKFRSALTFFAIGLALVPFKGAAQESRIKGLIDSTKTVALTGNVNPRAQAKYDLGPVDPSFKLTYITLALKPSVTQQAELEQLLAEQQDRSSPNHHKWLTPEQYADRFGLSAGDVAKIRTWLESGGFTISYVARGRNWLTFSGTAAQINNVFRTEIHRFTVEGETHYANIDEPSLPAVLAPVVVGLFGLDDLHPKSSSKAITQGPVPNFTGSNGDHALLPDDIATIYDIPSLYRAGLDGSGQRIVVVGQSAINQADIAAFRSGILPPNVPQVLLVPGATDPGPTNDQDEADLDIEWVGAVARNSTILYVYMHDADQAAMYAIDQDLAPIISESFGDCEATPSVAPATLRTFAQQGNSMGITWIASAGDSGAAACDSTTSSAATHGAAVEVPASVPEVTAVGGTQFNEGGGVYWSSTNSPDGGSALSYIPEMAWNESGPTGLAATGGGLSTVFPQPSWQVGPGLQNWGVRAVPDVALAAANNHDPYRVYTQGQWKQFGGTSAATPVFAGIVALVNENYSSAGLGNINPNLYRFAQTNIFHDITAGNNGVPCVIGSSTDCTTGYFGYNAGPGYDPVTGIGSVDAYNLVSEWNDATPSSNVVPGCSPDPVYEQQANQQGYSWFYTLALAETTGFGTSLTGFTINGTDYSAQIVNYFGTTVIPGKGTISVSLEAQDLTVPSNFIFGFSGVDAGGRQWSQQLSVPFNGMQSTPPPAISLSKTQLQFSWTVGGAVPPSQLLTVSNAGGGRFAWTASSNVSWLSLSLATGLLTVSLNPTGLAPGNYNGIVSVSASGVPNSPQSIAVALTVEAAAPSVVVSAVVNAASYQAGMSPGALATLFGTNLSPVVGIESPGGATSYRGVSVTVDGILAPLFTVANVNGQEQINFQIPEGLPGPATVVKVNNNGAVGTMNVAISPVQPGIFAYLPMGSSTSYAVIVKPDGSIAGPSNPATRGTTVVMFATGLGPTSPALSTGQAGPVPPATTNYLPVVTLSGVSAPVQFSGVAPGFIGLDQVNFTIPANVPVGSALQLGVSVNGVSGSASTIAIMAP